MASTCSLLGGRTALSACGPSAPSKPYTATTSLYITYVCSRVHTCMYMCKCIYCCLRSLIIARLRFLSDLYSQKFDTSRYTRCSDEKNTTCKTVCIIQSFLFFFFLPSVLEAAALFGGKGLVPFYAMLDGGKEGEFFKEMEEYFYYAQIKRSNNCV